MEISIGKESKKFSEEIIKKSFNLKTYQGKWYEVARYCNWFQKGCHLSEANYKVIDKDTISVHNICYYEDGTIRNQVKGTGKVLNNKYKGALYVSFPNWSWLSEPHINYIVHDTDYRSYAIVGSPDRKMFWILSRKKTMNKKTLEMVLKKSRELGYNVDNLVYDGKTTFTDKLYNFFVF